MHGSVVIKLCTLRVLVGPSGLEPPTSCLSGTRSNLLSYDPSRLVCGVSLGLVEMMGFEPMTPCLQGRCSPSWATPPFFTGYFISTRGSFPLPRSCWHWAIFPCRFQQSIFATAELNFCVRNGNRWTLCVITPTLQGLILENWTTLISEILSSFKVKRLHKSVFWPLIRSP